MNKNQVINEKYRQGRKRPSLKILLAKLLKTLMPREYARISPIDVANNYITEK